ncbi:hypothetical protein FAM09_28640 [Niastella caeni]|uniref:Uncharacterized protein n=1 Tax=Niastella caeni TaxID=2569763 RepID=A0A4S8HDV2_9BACT|nr:hypothetical protein [Niastella caeni]THU31594.1 hypothetical protein FAM09_28640 [Niastella caeni]
MVLIIACNSDESNQPTSVRSAVITNIDSTQAIFSPQLATNEKTAQEKKEIFQVTGNFDGDNIPDTGNLVLVRIIRHELEQEEVQLKGEEDDHEDTATYNYSLRFGGNRLGEIKDITGVEVAVTNEGDLNHDGKDEISVFSIHKITCFTDLTCYTFRNGGWVVLDEMQFHSCSSLDENELQSHIIMKDSVPWYYENSEAKGNRLQLKQTEH